MRQTYIFDLDGTLALIEHRRHFVEGKKKHWGKFYEACVDDEPNWPVIHILQQLHHGGGYRCEIWSGRSDEVQKQTVAWLLKFAVPYAELKMRPEGDYTPDHELKAAWLADFIQAYDALPLGVFDDRDRLVKMWRSMGVACFQVAPGDF